MKTNIPGADTARAMLHQLLDELFDRACADPSYAIVGGAVMTNCGDPNCQAKHPHPTLILSFHKEVSEGLLKMASGPDDIIEYHPGNPTPTEFH